jgi:hypothetical protein
MTFGWWATFGFGTLVAGFLLYRAVELAVGGARTVATLRRAADRKYPTAGPAGELPTFVLLLPMLREDRRIAAVCRHLLPVLMERRVSVVVITGEREGAERDAAQHALLDMAGQTPDNGWRELAVLAVGAPALPALGTALLSGDRPAARRLLTEHRRPTTGEVADSLLAELNEEAGWEGFHHICLADDGGTKVAKLDRALGRWLARYPDRSPGYVGVYDADSLPDLSVFAHLDAEVTDRTRRGAALPEVFQQVSCYCGNLRSLEGPGSLLSLADAMAQTCWALGFEYQLYRRYTAAVTSGRTRPLAYCIGHGCFVSREFLDRIGGFPKLSPTDDLALGFFASALGAQVAPVPALDYCDVAPDPILSMRQARFWFAGSVRFWRDLRYARDRFQPAMGRWQWITLHLAGFVRNIAWAGQGAAWVAAVVLAVATGQWILAAALVFAHVAYVQVGYIQTVWALYRLPGARAATGVAGIPRWRWAAGCLAASGNFLLRSLGPLLSTLAAGRLAVPTWKQER